MQNTDTNSTSNAIPGSPHPEQPWIENIGGLTLNITDIVFYTWSTVTFSTYEVDITERQAGRLDHLIRHASQLGKTVAFTDHQIERTDGRLETVRFNHNQISYVSPGNNEMGLTDTAKFQDRAPFILSVTFPDFDPDDILAAFITGHGAMLKAGRLF